MAANQTSNQKMKSGGRQQSAAAQRRPVPAEAATDYGPIGEMAEQASDYVQQGASETREFVRQHAGASIAVALATGFGIGLLVGHAIGKPHPRKWKDRIAAEGLGRRLLDRFEGLIPDALAERLGK